MCFFFFLIASDCLLAIADEGYINGTNKINKQTKEFTKLEVGQIGGYQDAHQKYVGTDW